MSLLKRIKSIFKWKTKLRELTSEEQHILNLIQELYGEQNTVEECFMTPDDGIAIFVKDRDGQLPIAVVLTNVAMFSKQDDLTDDEIKKQWLIPSTAFHN